MFEKLAHHSTEGPGFVLFLPSGAGYGGFLLWNHDGNQGPEGTLSIEISAAHARLIRVMAMEMEADSHLVESVRGWRSHQRLGELIGAETDWPPEVPTVRSYMTRIQKRINNKVREVDPRRTIPKLFEGRRKVGSRLRVPVQIMDGTLQERA